jgi:hypothetical protein
MVAVVVEATPDVVTVAVPLVFFAAIVTLAGCADDELLLRLTSTPPAGAGPEIVAVTVEVLPPTTLPGARETPVTVSV